MNDRPGTDVQHLRELAISLARDAIFWKEQLIKCSLSGRKHTGTLDQDWLIGYYNIGRRSKMMETNIFLHYQCSLLNTKDTHSIDA